MPRVDATGLVKRPTDGKLRYGDIVFITRRREWSEPYQPEELTVFMIAPWPDRHSPADKPGLISLEYGTRYPEIEFDWDTTYHQARKIIANKFQDVSVHDIEIIPRDKVRLILERC